MNLYVCNRYKNKIELKIKIYIQNIPENDYPYKVFHMWYGYCR